MLIKTFNEKTHKTLRQVHSELVRLRSRGVDCHFESSYGNYCIVGTREGCPNCGKDLSVSGSTKNVICSGYCGIVGYRVNQ